MSLMNLTLCYWVSCKAYASDVIDVVVYADVGDNKAIELGQENETIIDSPQVSRTRATWGYTRTTFMRQREEDHHRSHRTTI